MMIVNSIQPASALDLADLVSISTGIRIQRLVHINNNMENSFCLD